MATDSFQRILCQPRALPANLRGDPGEPEIAVIGSKSWGPGGVRLAVGFLDGGSAELRSRILDHLNAWGETANVEFVAGDEDPVVRITRTPGSGHWSYVGTDVLRIAPDEPTMNLDSFTMATPDSEFHRVVRHEAGHTLGFPHEHMRRELVARIDRDKAYEYYGRTQGWSRLMVDRQVLTAIEDGSLFGTEHTDPTSIMCYHVPASITVDGRAIEGGTDINDEDRAFAAKVYPRAGGAR